MKKAPRPLVIIEWRDACSIDAWTDVSDVDHELAVIVTAGMLVGENDHAVTVALNLDVSNEKTSCLISIPKGWIVGRRQLRLQPAPRPPKPRAD